MEKLSPDKLKQLRKLKQKKFRDEEKTFQVEGHKLSLDMLQKLPPKYLVATREWFEEHLPGDTKHKFVATKKQLDQLTLLKHPSPILAYFSYMDAEEYPFESTKDESLILALDSIRDPGNFGTILRTAHWFGIKHIICSEDTVDRYNLKSIQASMGSFASVSIHYCSLKPTIEELKKSGFLVTGAFMDGEPIKTFKSPNKNILIVGNEGSGIAEDLHPLIDKKITIPYSDKNSHPESLNVASASSIILSYLS